MNRKPLSETNPYIIDPETRRKLVERSVVSSCGVEGIKVDFSKAPSFQIIHRQAK